MAYIVREGVLVFRNNAGGATAELADASPAFEHSTYQRTATPTFALQKASPDSTLFAKADARGSSMAV